MISCSHWGMFRWPGYQLAVDLSLPWWTWDYNQYDE